MVKSPDTCVLRDKENLSFLQDTIPRKGKIASALLHAVCTCEFIPCSQSNEGCVTRFISRANSALELRFFSKLWVAEDDTAGFGAIMRGSLNGLLRICNPNLNDIFAVLPKFFLEENNDTNLVDMPERNVLIEPIRGRRIAFDTIHGVKGETHDATLYLETNRQGASDLKRILPYFGAGPCGSSNLYDSSRKLAYVGMSRPKKLLCVAMQAATYEKSKGVFDTDWEVVDLRE